MSRNALQQKKPLKIIISRQAAVSASSYLIQIILNLNKLQKYSHIPLSQSIVKRCVWRNNSIQFRENIFQKFHSIGNWKAIESHEFVAIRILLSPYSQVNAE